MENTEYKVTKIRNIIAGISLLIIIFTAALFGYIRYTGGSINSLFSAVQEDICKINGEVQMDEKPVIYLYGYDNINVKVKLSYDGKITSTYPKYNKTSGWNVTAQKNGTLRDAYNRSYNYLFWEGEPRSEYKITKGVCIKGSETEKYLEETLKSLGLVDKEAGDFITYWLPKMQNNKYNVISFLEKEYTDKAKLSVTPKPEHMIRIFMAWFPSDKEVNIKEQEIEPVKRPMSGTYLVEWGGAQLKGLNSEDEEDVSSNTISQNSSDDEPSYRNKTPLEMTLEENALRQQELMNELAELQQAALIKQTLNGGASQVNTAGTHPFTDKNGQKTTFTDAEWNKLLSYWTYTGNAEFYVKEHTIGELRNLLR